MNDIENLKKDITFINDFTTEFFNKTSKYNNSTVETIKRLDEIIEVEKNNEKFLHGIEESITDNEIQKTSENLDKHLQEISEKQSEYIRLISQNSKKITELSKQIRDKMGNIDSIYKTCEKLEQAISLVVKT
jgi:chromosome segregation ATPase